MSLTLQPGKSRARLLRAPASRSSVHMPFSLKHARVVLPDGVRTVSIVVRDGVIHKIDAVHAATARRIDCDGDYLLPGLIEPHTDNFERHLEPRPGTFWSADRAVLAHDAELASAGITTALDAITVGGDLGSGAREHVYLDAISSLETAEMDGLLRIEHHLHLRCELTHPLLSRQLEAALARRAPRLVSLMNHAPGQGQWTDVERFRAYYARRYGMSPEEIEVLIARRQAARAEFAAPNRELVLEIARQHHCVLASHDDSTVQDVTAARGCECSIAEFPTSVEAAREARRVGMRVVAGAPNLVRGVSHSGNVAAADLAREELIDILSSDYCPSSLLHAVFILQRSFDVPLHRAVAMVSAIPARALGLHDRGSIEEGKRADLVRVRETLRGPVIVSVWSAGRQVA